MAVATKSQGKTSFVRKFLENNPQANGKAVNEAWTGAGMTGAISHPVISEIRKQLGLIGNQPGRTTKATRAKSGTKVSKKTSTPGKAMFVKEFLHDNPQGNVAAVNKAWKAAGFVGTISKTIIYKVKSSMGLTENARKSMSSATSKKRGRPRLETTAAVSVQAGRNNGDLDDLEAEIDRLLFKVMAIGDLTEIENMLRRTRRLLYGALTRG